MGEHVGIRRLTTFFRQCYDMLEDDGAMYVQLTGLRKAWQYEDFIRGLFLNQYIFPGADASTPRANYVGCLESAGWEIKSINTVGVHNAGTLWRWCRNWLGNGETIKAKYGQRWFRMWELFLARSTIASSQGSATCFQMVVIDWTGSRLSMAFRVPWRRVMPLVGRSFQYDWFLNPPLL
ncbi:sphingolipid C9-methyltransferase [Verticillium alfalfae VaMs.102]|uniref:sphingolipid C(9)-methyltransferase n=1 Tax=Verticillium alfalfae (strain VaMs.102 / ATCC MYA-4576 / FGSC 10136) TaxID=526221 RepID=C9SL13_VERA1|nr:sphingolipid C9-methyltransferase [Verticillium alfalfae VaMs.102]EEY19381.1 sphingolipid C9-methyltransferase [Verticillium alfalfae VaMs.102]